MDGHLNSMASGQLALPQNACIYHNVGWARRKIQEWRARAAQDGVGTRRPWCCCVMSAIRALASWDPKSMHQGSVAPRCVPWTVTPCSLDHRLPDTRRSCSLTRRSPTKHHMRNSYSYIKRTTHTSGISRFTFHCCTAWRPFCDMSRGLFHNAKSLFRTKSPRINNTEGYHDAKRRERNPFDVCSRLNLGIFIFRVFGLLRKPTLPQRGV